MTTQTPQTRQTGKGFILAVFSALLLGSTAIIIRHLTETYRIPALVLAFWRDVIVTLVLALILLIIFIGMLTDESTDSLSINSLTLE